MAFLIHPQNGVWAVTAAVLYHNCYGVVFTNHLYDFRRLTHVEGETVTITPGTPVVGYNLSAEKYNDGTDHVLTKSDEKYSFAMPAATVTISSEYLSNTFAVTYNPGTNGTGS